MQYCMWAFHCSFVHSIFNTSGFCETKICIEWIRWHCHYISVLKGHNLHTFCMHFPPKLQLLRQNQRKLIGTLKDVAPVSSDVLSQNCSFLTRIHFNATFHKHEDKGNRLPRLQAQVYWKCLFLNEKMSHCLDTLTWKKWVAIKLS